MFQQFIQTQMPPSGQQTQMPPSSFQLFPPSCQPTATVAIPQPQTKIVNNKKSSNNKSILSSNSNLTNLRSKDSQSKTLSHALVRFDVDQKVSVIKTAMFVSAISSELMEQQKYLVNYSMGKSQMAQYQALVIAIGSKKECDEQEKLYLQNRLVEEDSSKSKSKSSKSSASASKASESKENVDICTSKEFVLLKSKYKEIENTKDEYFFKLSEIEKELSQVRIEKERLQNSFVNDQPEKWIEFAKNTLAIFAPSFCYANGNLENQAISTLYPKVLVENTIIQYVEQMIKSQDSASFVFRKLAYAIIPDEHIWAGKTGSEMREEYHDELYAINGKNILNYIFKEYFKDLQL
jgi:hypothetical protein